MLMNKLSYFSNRILQETRKTPKGVNSGEATTAASRGLATILPLRGSDKLKIAFRSVYLEIIGTSMFCKSLPRLLQKQ